MNIVYLLVLGVDVVLFVTKGILSGVMTTIIIGTIIVIETTMQFLTCMQSNVWIIILSMCILMTNILVDCWMQCCIIGAKLIRYTENKPPKTPVYNYQ